MRAEPFSDDDLTRNAFLGGRVRLWQPRGGYRAGIDPVLLAASVPADPGQSVLELGCGAGAALACLGARVPGLALTGVELQPAYAALARRNLAENGLDGRIVEADLTALPRDMRAQSFAHVLANPPYFDASRRSAASDAGRDMAQAGGTPLADWVDCAARRLAPGGTATFIQRMDRLPELLAAMQARLGSLALWPIAARAGRDAGLMLLRGRKGGRAAFVCHAPLILHSGARHERDGDDYTPQISDVLRLGQALLFPTQSR
ncbi:tRNA1(Val) (adenine(37)-N6)-methyltransferase [Aestuariicoccus sp. MJ-SS9]|uniref:tRNA1(Val) (adenine(37)-N6)-methyltransferase n=1 Tax=Aestuariicoccus sp. MJ-SS9 TaxID=3079855 RepID=UPI0029147211|nr:methyltransferase domain-containing protein [Aestuariicoccus sp. MJ-SS9]MDU8913807.1 methyltransferase [Aestuariicoccus sp. MJ-SS9]